jgi:hypothetical protein
MEQGDDKALSETQSTSGSHQPSFYTVTALLDELAMFD